jgi:septal ring factor EnvC (AmiA/AmiB activator)
MTEEWWALEVNYFLSQRFDLSHDLPVVFIDSFANMEDPSEEVAFRYNSRQLMVIMTNLATKEKFLFQDISRVRSELSAASYKAKKLELDVKIMEEKISNLTEKNRILQRLKAELNNPLKKLESMEKKAEKKCKAYKDEYQYSINAIYVAAICGFLVPGKQRLYHPMLVV